MRECVLGKGGTQSGAHARNSAGACVPTDSTAADCVPPQAAAVSHARRVAAAPQREPAAEDTTLSDLVSELRSELAGAKVRGPSCP